MTKSIRRIIIIIIHINNNVPFGSIISDISFFTQSQFFFIFHIFYLWYMGYHILYFVVTIINNNPFYSMFGICLMLKTFQHHRNKRSSIECRSTDSNKRIFLRSGIFYILIFYILVFLHIDMDIYLFLHYSLYGFYGFMYSLQFFCYISSSVLSKQ